jgi:hypothetical protein
MKKITKLLMTLLFMLLVIQAQAQIKRIGIKSGLNLSKGEFVNQLYGDIFNSQMKNLAGGQLMFYWESSKNDYFVTQVGLGYTGKGFNIAQDTLKMKLRLHYLELPIIFKFRLPITGPVKIMAGFGPYFDFAFAGKQVTDGSTDHDIIEYGVDKSKNDRRPYNPGDIGLVFSGNFEINLPQGKNIEVGVDYNLGISKISNTSAYWLDVTPVNPGLKSGVLSITVSYLLDLSKDKKKSKKVKTDQIPEQPTQIAPTTQP